MEGNDLYFEKGLPIRFKVQQIKFSAPPTLADQNEDREKKEPVRGSQQRPHVPLLVVGRADGDGLGMTHWYSGEEEDMKE